MNNPSFVPSPRPRATHRFPWSARPLVGGLLAAVLAAGCLDEAPDVRAEPDVQTSQLEVVQREIDTLLAAVDALEALVRHDQLTSGVGERLEMIDATVLELATAGQELRELAGDAAATRRLSIAAGQLAPQLRKLARA
ncbi:MAG: hypothetical protein ACTHU0_07450, partial [Kofleriaceae bacterium]